MGKAMIVAVVLIAIALSSSPASSTTSFAGRATLLPITDTPIQTTTVIPINYLPLVIRALPTPTPTNTPTPTRDPAHCAAEYPTVCIPPPPPDLNCGDIVYRNFTVLPPDRHKFDTDHDGIG